jgi:hypothetical protein
MKSEKKKSANGVTEPTDQELLRRKWEIVSNSVELSKMNTDH